jgi:GntR family transcriptional repressor for pyruvate dehydrogenase complex
MFEPIRTARAFEAVADQIVQAIAEGDLRPGDRLPSERTLAWQMEVSRPTLREGVKVLSDAGVLEVRPGGMFVATDAIPSELRPAPHPELRISEVAGVLEARRLLEPRVAQLAAIYGTDDDLQAMRETIELMRESAPQHDRLFQLDQRFHLAMARATGNQTLIELMRRLLRQLAAVRQLAMTGPHDPEWAVKIHERTLEAIVAGDPAGIEAVMDEHLAYLERTWEEETDRARLRRLPDFLLQK